jgi:protein-disulfide isomerase
MNQGRGRTVLGIVADLASIVSAITILSGAILLTISAGRHVLATSAADRAHVTAVRPQPPSSSSPIDIVSGLETTKNINTRNGHAARVAIVEFSDYQCPYCGRFARDLFPKLNSDFLGSGTVAYVFRNYPLEKIHPLALKASEAADCAAEQGKFWEMHNRLFDYQGHLDQPSLELHAAAIGLNKNLFSRCLDQDRTAGIREDQAEGRRLGVKGTPTFFIGTLRADGKIIPTHRIVGTPSYEEMKTVIEETLSAQIAAR